MTQYQRILGIVCLAVGISLVVSFAARIGHKRGYREGWRGALASAVPDTVVVAETLRVETPVPQYVFVDREKPVFLPVHDTALVVIRDTTYIAVEREIRGYSGNDYRAQVSGIAPALDWIEVYPKTTTIDRIVVKPAPRVSFGMTIGPCALWNGSLHAGVGVAAGIQVRFGK